MRKEIKINFNNEPEGLVTEDQIKKLFLNPPPKIVGPTEGLISITKDPLGSGSKVLQIKYPAGIIQDQKTRWKPRFEPVEAATLSYKVMFPKDFDFVRGGKLPGLAGGSAPMGGASTAEADGFSFRIMWREFGVLCNYVYNMDKNKTWKWGANFLYTSDIDKNKVITKEMWQDMDKRFEDRMYLVPGQWHELKTYIKMNTPGKEDGKIISWLDGKEAVNINLRFRKDNSFGIDKLLFTTFFGGNDETWAPKKEEVVYFDDIKIVLE